jgi:hypothetical protein
MPVNKALLAAYEFISALRDMTAEEAVDFLTNNTGEDIEQQLAQALMADAVQVPDIEHLDAEEHALTSEFIRAISTYRAPDDADLPLVDQFRFIADRIESDKPEKK